MNKRPAIKKRVLQLCEERHLTIYELSERAELPISTINYILSDKSKKPRITTIVKLCNGLKISLDAFFDTPEFNALEQEIK